MLKLGFSESRSWLGVFEASLRLTARKNLTLR